MVRLVRPRVPRARQVATPVARQPVPAAVLSVSVQLTGGSVQGGGGRTRAGRVCLCATIRWLNTLRRLDGRPDTERSYPMLKTTLAAAAVTVGHAAHASGTGFQATIGSPSDFPGATGLAYRYLDAYDSSDVDGGWVIGGWAQHASAIARVGENGTVLWSHKMHYKHPDHPGDEDGQTALSDVAALPDGGAAFVGYAYYVVPSKTQCFVGRLSPAGEIIYLNDYSSSGGAGWDSCVLSGIVSNGDQSVLVIGEDKADGAFSAQLDKAGKPLSGWAVGADGLQFKSVSGGDGVRLADDSYVYSFNGDVPNRRQLQGGIPTGFWGLMHLNSSGAPIASHHFGDTKWGHNCIVAAVPTDQGAATGPESGGFILAGNLEQPQSVNSEKPYVSKPAPRFVFVACESCAAVNV